MYYKKLNKIIKIINEYRLFLKGNYSVFYKNRNYFYTILSSMVNFNIDMKYINRNEFKKILSFKSEKDIRMIVDNYFCENYKINTEKISYDIINDNIQDNSQCCISNNNKFIKLRIDNNIQDCLVMAHEFRHYLNMDVNRQNPIQDCLTETLSIFEEINISNYIVSNKIAQKEEINLLIKMVYLKNFLIAKKNLVFLKLDQIITNDGFIDNRKKEEIYLNEAEFENDLKEFLKIYNDGNLNVHTMIWYNIGTIVSVQINNNIKEKRIKLNNIEKLNKQLINSNNFEVLKIVDVDLNNINQILNNYKKELERLF